MLDLEKSDLYLMKIQINFVFRKKSYLYLMKIHINFLFRKKKIRYVFNENINQFCVFIKKF